MCYYCCMPSSPVLLHIYCPSFWHCNPYIYILQHFNGFYSLYRVIHTAKLYISTCICYVIHVDMAVHKYCVFHGRLTSYTLRHNVFIDYPTTYLQYTCYVYFYKTISTSLSLVHFLSTQVESSSSIRSWLNSLQTVRPLSHHID